MNAYIHKHYIMYVIFNFTSNKTIFFIIISFDINYSVDNIIEMFV